MSNPTENPTNSLTDFSDRMSPVLVKELRQGLRTNLFVFAFILLQAFMILCLMMGQPGDSSASDGAFWVFLFIVFIIVQPLRGFSSLSQEYAYNTMDLIQLTKLNALRIALGKWCALNAQSLLFLVSVLPYLVMRYFYGSVDVVGDFKMLMGYAFSSAVLSAIAVGCSSFKQIIPRLILLIASVWGFMFFFFETLNSYFKGFEVVLLFFCGVIVGAYFLFLGASRISPHSENHSTRKRVLGLIGSAGSLGFIFLGVDKELCLGFAAVIALITTVDAISENLPIFHGVLPPFNQSFLTRFLAGFLTPGWHTGLRFALVTLIPIMLFAVFSTKLDIHIPPLLFAALTFPLLIIHIFFKKSSIDHLALYIAVQACCLAVAALVSGVGEGLPGSALSDIIYLVIPLPMVLLFGENKVDDFLLICLGTGWTLITLIVMTIVSRKPFGAMREFFKSLSN